MCGVYVCMCMCACLATFAQYNVGKILQVVQVAIVGYFTWLHGIQHDFHHFAVVVHYPVDGH